MSFWRAWDCTIFILWGGLGFFWKKNINFNFCWKKNKILHLARKKNYDSALLWILVNVKIEKKILTREARKKNKIILLQFEKKIISGTKIPGPPTIRKWMVVEILNQISRTYRLLKWLESGVILCSIPFQNCEFLTTNWYRWCNCRMQTLN